MKTFVYLLIGLTLASCKQKSIPGPVEIFCDAERIVNINGGKYFGNNRYLIANGQTQTDLEAYSGTHSSLVTVDNRYGLSVKFRNIHIGDRYQVEVMRKSKHHYGQLSVNCPGVFFQSQRGITTLKNGWQRLRLEFVIDTINADRELEIHTWIAEDDSAFFDDLKIVYVPAGALLQSKYICTNNNPYISKYLFLGHIYQSYCGENKIDHRIEAMDKTCFDQMWLGGDVCVNTTKDKATLGYLDDIFDLGNPHTYWAMGNHDIRCGHLDNIEQYTHRKTWNVNYNNGFTVVVLNTNLEQSYEGQELCENMEEQFNMLKNVCDTIKKSSHLIVLMHHVLWYAMDKYYWRYTNETKSSWRARCDSNTTFKNCIYPMLADVQSTGVQVICIAGDAGLRGRRIYKQAGHYKSPEGVQFLTSGLGNSNFYREQQDSIPNDKILVLYHDKANKNITWKFHDLDSLLGAQLVLF